MRAYLSWTATAADGHGRVCGAGSRPKLLQIEEVLDIESINATAAHFFANLRYAAIFRNVDSHCFLHARKTFIYRAEKKSLYMVW